ncbi:hypothetical protein AB0O07_07370 [Streptomyces sp. NPDC093085]|uniref:hypothetical protein n=1 Tax=Streptomyces sp. NPDC093085 TaxID=3155068 RepID=UPI003441D844
MTPPATARILATLGAHPARSGDGRQGALWRLAEPGRALDANAVRLPPGAAVAEHTDTALDVLLVVLDGAGVLGTAEGDAPLTPYTVVWLPKTSRRSLTAGPDGLVYLTAHPRRPGMTIGGAPPPATERPAPVSRPAAEPAEGGEPACALDRVCAECGRLAGERDARFCARCGHPLTGLT